MSHRDVSGALFSALLPGVGQFAQGRVLAGIVFLLWTVGGVIGAAYLHRHGQSAVALAIEVALVALWSIIDAYRHPVQAPTAAI